MRYVFAIFSLFMSLAFGAAAATAAPSPVEVAVQIHELVGPAATQGIAGEPVLAAELRAVYAAFADRPLWQLDPSADSRRRALEALLGAVATHGIVASDVHLKAIAALAGGGTARIVAERDVLLTDALLRYATELRRGAVAGSALGPDWHIAPDPFNPVSAVIAALRSEGFAEFLRVLPPADPHYEKLRQALQSYREIARRGGWTPIPGKDELKLDGRDPRMAVLRDRLAAEGELPAATHREEIGRIATAVRLFQATHGLEADGRVGRKTLAALNVSADERVEQIAANLERWRHVPRDFGRTYVAVNLADASLDLVEDGATVFRTRVIIGDVRHPSPDIRAMITGVTFNPPWNVPPSIAIKEMLPRLRRDPGYLAANDIVIVGRDNGDPFGLHVDWRRISGQAFPFRLQQRPGAKNSLGVIKLEMPNAWDVYLHDTPVKALFQRAQRGFSHGCVRVQEPAELARRLLDDPAWDAEAMRQAVAAGVTHTVVLRRPVPVYLLYWTVFVDADGAVDFRDDIYSRDAPIERALGLDKLPTNANELQRTASCSRPMAGLSLQGG